jgi:hypothetical protein
MRLARCGMHGEMRNAYKMLVSKPDGMRPFTELRQRQDDTIKTDFKEIECDGVEWIQLAQGYGYVVHSLHLFQADRNYR